MTPIPKGRSAVHIVSSGGAHTIAATLALLAGLAATASAQTYYVDNQSATCSDAGAGTEAQPYCTIAAAVAAHHAPAETIVVKPGIYREQITVPASGAAEANYVIRALGAGALLDGADDFANAGLWVPSTGTVFLASSVTWGARQVFVDGARLSPSTLAPASLPVNAFTWVSGEGLYVNLGGDSPGAHQTLVGRRNYGFNIFSKSWVTLDGFEITRTEDRGINIQNGCSDLVIARNRVSFANSYGIQTVNGARILIDANVISDCNLHGIGLTAGANGCIVRDNESFRNADPAVRRANGIHLHAAPGNTLCGNRLHHNQDTGLQFTTGSHGCFAFNNRSWNNGDHGYDHLNVLGTVHIHDAAFGNFKDGFSIEGDSPNSQLYNCIAVDNGLTTDEFDLWVNDLSSVGFVSDYNIFWNSTLQEPIKYIATKYATVAGYQAASGQDAHSMQANPMFADGAAGDFRLLPGSAAIDAAHSGIPGWPATDALGGARVDDLWTVDEGVGPITYADIGALEFVPAADAPPVVTAISSIQAVPGSTVTFTVTALDPDGQPIQSLTMVPVNMPSGSGAVFTTNADNTAGTFTWAVPTTAGNYKVSFIAANVLADTASTNIHVKKNGRIAGRHEAEGTEKAEEAAIAVLALSNGFPNPSRGNVEFALDLPRDAQVRWVVFDLQGRMVWSEERAFGAGRTRLRWNGATAGHERAATGVYLVRAWVEGAQFTRRVVRF